MVKWSLKDGDKLRDFPYTLALGGQGCRQIAPRRRPTGAVCPDPQGSAGLRAALDLSWVRRLLRRAPTRRHGREDHGGQGRFVRLCRPALQDCLRKGRCARGRTPVRPRRTRPSERAGAAIGAHGCGRFQGCALSPHWTASCAISGQLTKALPNRVEMRLYPSGRLAPSPWRTSRIERLLKTPAQFRAASSTSVLPGCWASVRRLLERSGIPPQRSRRRRR